MARRVLLPLCHSSNLIANLRTVAASRVRTLILGQYRKVVSNLHLFSIMACAQTLVGTSLTVRQTPQSQIARRQSRRPFTTLATIERGHAAYKLNAGALSQVLTAGAAAAMLLVR